MNKNIMKEIAELLGVELNEKFNIKGLRFPCNPYQFKEHGFIDRYGRLPDIILRYLLTGECTIEKHILNEKEREYLANVIAPKQIYENVIHISKNYIDGVYRITVCINGNTDINLPFFSDKNMYKGMELKKEYTLDELGLSRDEQNSKRKVGEYEE